ncbi:hypothetical protein ScPMuIL_011835 [Solemya velum]
MERRSSNNKIPTKLSSSSSLIGVWMSSTACCVGFVCQWEHHQVTRKHAPRPDPFLSLQSHLGNCDVLKLKKRLKHTKSRSNSFG